jgi:FAD dependent oxidoreductase
MYPRILPLLLLLSLPIRAAEKENPPELNAYIIVYGDASVGVSAAVQAVLMGKSVILVSQSGHLGGLTSSGLGDTDIGNRKILGGIFRDFYHRIYLHCRNEAAERHRSHSVIS